MANKLVVLGAAAAALLAVSGIFDAADARRGGGASGHHSGRPSMGAPRSFSPPAARAYIRPTMQASRGHRIAHQGHRRHLTSYGYYGYVPYDSCTWLRQNALRTGNPSWWYQYYACLDGYGAY